MLNVILKPTFLFFFFFRNIPEYWACLCCGCGWRCSLLYWLLQTCPTWWHCHLQGWEKQQYLLLLSEDLEKQRRGSSIRTQDLRFQGFHLATGGSADCRNSWTWFRMSTLGAVYRGGSDPFARARGRFCSSLAQYWSPVYEYWWR